MKKIVITNSDNTKMSVDLIRYFKFKNDCFLIYTLGEKDEKNYVKLYLVRIMEELGFPVVQTIRNDADWASMQDIVKKVLKELKKGKKKLTEDLDCSEIDGIKIVNPRFFKLDSKLVDLLSSNYMEDNQTDLHVESSNFMDNSSNDNDLDNSIINGLEPIEQTMMKQSMEYNQADLTQEDLMLIQNQSQDVSYFDLHSNYSEPIKTGFKEETDVAPILPIVDNQDNSLSYNAESSIDNSLNVSNDNNKNNVGNSTIDYKKLYDSLKADNDATNELLNTVMYELNIYKEKYGELNIN